MPKIVFWHLCYLALRSRSKVGVKVTLKVKGQSQISGVQRSILGARLCRVQQRAKKSHYQSYVFVCVSSNRVDAVDRLLIYFAICYQRSFLQFAFKSFFAWQYFTWRGLTLSWIEHPSDKQSNKSWTECKCYPIHCDSCPQEISVKYSGKTIYSVQNNKVKWIMSPNNRETILFAKVVK